jgi:alpha-beta hydrolase superfamily lysophospholipase
MTENEIQHFNGSWQTQDSLSLYFQGWEPEDAPHGVVCLIHGLGEHSGRYAHLAAFLVKNGMALISFDLRGHGKSGGPRGHAPSFESFIADIDLLFNEAKKRYAGLPMFLYGHSLGGILGLNYALRHNPDVVGVVITSAGLRTSLEEQKLKITLANVLGSILPTLSMPTGLDADMLSRDPQVAQIYRDDPLVHDRATLGMAKNTLDAIQWAFEHAHSFPKPLLLMHGTQDELAYARGSQEFAERVGDDCTLKLWEGFYHELHNEPEQQEVFTYLLEWLHSQD